MIAIVQAAGWPIWLLVACSILALALVVERFISLRRRVVGSPEIVTQATRISGDALADAGLLQRLATHDLQGRVLAAGWRALVDNPRCSAGEMRGALEAEGRAAAHELNRHLPALGAIVSAAPLLGLFGTVIGMIEIFGSQAAGGALAGGDPTQLAHGISVALYNTAFGLIIAIPTLFFWQYFRARVAGYVLELETGAERFTRHLEPMCAADAVKDR